MKFILLPLGSAGDVHPLIFLAQILRARGHDVVIICQTMVAEIPERCGLRTIPVGTRENQESVIRNPDIWHPRKGFFTLAEHLPLWARETLPAIKSELTPDTILLAGGVAFAGKIAAEAWHVPMLSVQVQPIVFQSIDAPPIMSNSTRWLPHAPRFIRKAVFSFINRIVDSTLAKPVNDLRREYGLTTPVRRLMRSWWHSEDGVIALFPEWFAPTQADWPPHTFTSRFPLYDESSDRPLDPALESFLAAGDPPILFTPGSANAHAADFFAAASAACQRLSRRALFITRYPEQVAHLPANAAVFPYVPFSRAFPRAAAIVHHGGIGTCAQGLAAGVPQLLMVLSHDQPDNAARLQKLGVASWLTPRTFTPKRVAAALQTLLDSPPVAESCARVKSLMAAQMPPGQVAAQIESLAQIALRKSPLPQP